MDTLWAAVRHLAASSLDYTGWRLSGQRDRPIRAEFHSGRNHWWFRPGLAADRGAWYVPLTVYRLIVGQL